MSVRYTAILKIVKVETTMSARDGDKSVDTELLNLIVRNLSLKGLINKLKGHLDLVEETE